jgi:ferritin
MKIFVIKITFYNKGMSFFDVTYKGLQPMQMLERHLALECYLEMLYRNLSSIACLCKHALTCMGKELKCKSRLKYKCADKVSCYLEDRDQPYSIISPYSLEVKKNFSGATDAAQYLINICVAAEEDVLDSLKQMMESGDHELAKCAAYWAKCQRAEITCLKRCQTKLSVATEGTIHLLDKSMEGEYSNKEEM